MSLSERVAQAAANPGRAASVTAALLRGWLYRVWFAVTGRRVVIGRNFRVEGRLVVRGPGKVVFGNDVTVGMHVTPWTYARDAVITVGDRCILNGTRFGCIKEIAIGPDGLIGEAHIMDTSFHSTAKDRRSRTATPRVAPVSIGPNVWVTFNVGIMPGTRIGANCVVGFGAVCSGVYEEDSLIVGNPAKVVKKIEETAKSGLSEGS